MTARETLRLNLQWLRKKNKMTQHEVSTLVGMKRSNYGAVEEGRSTLSPDLLLNFSKLYVVSIDILLSQILDES